jgi:putative transposase
LIKSGANTAALAALQKETGATIELRQSQYLNTRVEQDPRAVKRVVRPMLGFKSFRSAKTTLQEIDLLPMFKKRQMISVEGQALSAAEQFYSLAA